MCFQRTSANSINSCRDILISANSQLKHMAIVPKPTYMIIAEVIIFSLKPRFILDLFYWQVNI
jgi:hypothetical protein